MTILTEGRHAGEFMVSEANGWRSRATGIVLADEVLDVGQVVEKDGDGKLVAFTGETDTDGNLVAAAAGIMWAAVDATGADVTGAVYIARDAEVNASEIFVADDDTDGTVLAAARESLAAIGIIVRDVPANTITA